MANRSYIYAYQPGGEPEYRDLGEWKTHVPLIHLLMVGIDTQPVRSMLWDVEETIALQGDAQRGLEVLENWLDWLEPQMDRPGFLQEKTRAMEMLRREDRRGARFHLEPGEVFDLMGLSLEEMQRETDRLAMQAQRHGVDACRVVEEGMRLEDSAFARLQEGWEDEEHGLYFPGVLYFHVG